MQFKILKREKNGEINTIKSRYGLKAITDLSIPELKTLSHKIVKKITGKVIGWILEIRINRKGGKVEKVLIATLDDKAIALDPSKILLLNDSLYYIEPSDTKLFDEILESSNHNYEFINKNKVLEKIAGLKKINNINIETPIDRYKDNIENILIKDHKNKTTVEIVGEMEEKVKKEIEELFLKWFLGEVPLDDFTDSSEKLNKILEQLIVIRKALTGKDLIEFNES